MTRLEEWLLVRMSTRKWLVAISLSVAITGGSCFWYGYKKSRWDFRDDFEVEYQKMMADIIHRNPAPPFMTGIIESAIAEQPERHRRILEIGELRKKLEAEHKSPAEIDTAIEALLKKQREE